MSTEAERISIDPDYVAAGTEHVVEAGLDA